MYISTRAKSDRTILSCFFSLLLIALAARAQTPVESFIAGKVLDLVQPNVRPQTAIIVHVDMARIDINLLHDWLVSGVAGAKLSPDDTKFATEGIEIYSHQAGDWVANFRKAGGRHLIIMISYGDNTGEVTIVPIEPGADARAIQGILFSGKPDGPTTDADQFKDNPGMSRWVQSTHVVGNSVIKGTRSAIDEIVKTEPATRPELKDALEPAGNAPARVAVIPPERLRVLLENLLGKTLPEFLGGGTVSSLTRDFLWISVSCELPPTESIRFVAQCRDDNAAIAANRMISAGLKFLSTMPSMPDQPNWAQLIAGLAPKVEGSRVTLTVDTAHIENLKPVLLYSLAQARKSAEQVASLSNMRVLIMECIRYQADNKGEWPADLDTVVKKSFHGDATVLQNPQRPDLKPGYVYVKPNWDLTGKAQQTIVIYEASDEKTKIIGAGFADGHCERLPRARFEKMLIDSQSGGGENGL